MEKTGDIFFAKRAIIFEDDVTLSRKRLDNSVYEEFDGVLDDNIEESSFHRTRY